MPHADLLSGFQTTYEELKLEEFQGMYVEEE